MHRKISALHRVAEAPTKRTKLCVKRVSPKRLDVVWPRPVGLQSARRLASLTTERYNYLSPLLTRPPEGIKGDGKKKRDGREKKDKKDKLKLDKKDKDSTEKKDKEDKRDEKDEKSTPEKKKRRTRKRSKCAPSQEEEEDPRCSPARAVVPQQVREASPRDNSHDEGQAPGQGEEEGAQQWMRRVRDVLSASSCRRPYVCSR